MEHHPVTGFPIAPADYVPPGGTDRAVAVAHAAQSVLSNVAHASRHADAAAAAGTAEHKMFNVTHCHNHVGRALQEQDSSISNLVQLDPRAGAELEDSATPARPARHGSTRRRVPPAVAPRRTWQRRRAWP